MAYLCGVNLKNICLEACEHVRETGAFIKDQRMLFNSKMVSDKGLNQLVSYVDIEAEKMLANRLNTLLPEAGFITEENTREPSRKQLNWIIDPLDGTTNFIHGLPVYSVSVALAEGEQILCGIVFEIGRDEMFCAWKGGGAWCNGSAMHVSNVPSLSAALLATGFPYYNFEQMEDYISALKTFMQSTHGLRRMGSAAVDLAYVACGRFEGFFEYGLNAWDVAAGCLLVTEAGGKTSDFKNGNDFLFGKTILADNGILHKDMLDVISAHFK